MPPADMNGLSRDVLGSPLAVAGPAWASHRERWGRVHRCAGRGLSRVRSPCGVEVAFFECALECAALIP